MNNKNKFMERPKSTAADISREVRGWGVFAIGAAITGIVAYTAFTVVKKGKAAVTDILDGHKKKKDDNEFETVS
jgi:hypothetical protein